MMKRTKNLRLQDLKNVGPATLNDLKILGITSIDQLSQTDPSHLYRELERITGAHQDPCVWDIFAAIVHEAQTGEPSSWWQWSAIRKQHTLCDHHVPRKKSERLT